MSNFYNPPTHSDWCTPEWGDDVEKALGSGNPATGFDWIIFKDGTTYKGRSGTTGKINTTLSSTTATTCIQAAIDNLAGSGGSILLKGGTTYETAGVQILLNADDSDLAIFGEGVTTKMIDSTGGGGADTSIFKIDGSTTAVNNIRISNLALESTAIPATDTHGIIARYCYHSMFDHLWIKDVDEEGIALVRECDYNIVSNNSFYECGAAGVDCNVGSDWNVIANNVFRTCTNIELSASASILVWEGAAPTTTVCRYNTIIGNVIQDSKGDGIRLEGARYNSVVGNTLQSPVKGISVPTSIGGTNDGPNTISGNTIHNADASSIVTTVDDQNIVGNTIIGNTLYRGVYLNGADDCNVAGNHISNCSVGVTVLTGLRNNIASTKIMGCTSHGIHLTTTSDGCSILACCITQNGGDGIKLTTSDYTTISACQISSNTGTGVQEDNDAPAADFNLLDGCILTGNGAAHTVDAANSVVGDVI